MAVALLSLWLSVKNAFVLHVNQKQTCLNMSDLPQTSPESLCIPCLPFYTVLAVVWFKSKLSLGGIWRKKTYGDTEFTASGQCYPYQC